MRYIICSKCKQKKNIRHHRYKEILKNRFGGDKNTLKKKYVCMNCQKPKIIEKNQIINKISSENYNKDLYYNIKAQITDKVNTLYKRGFFIKGNRDQFYYDCKNILIRYKINDFVINVKDNKIHSILCKNIPIINTYEIKIEE
jgi:hypothetical protein